jgi:hypothetical protein
MTYHLQFLKNDGSLSCFFATECGSDLQAKAIAKSLLKLRVGFAGVEIVRGDELIYQELKSGKPN